MQSFILNVGEKFVSVAKESKFREAGRLTPEEVKFNINLVSANYNNFPSKFVASGDYLVFKCPTWAWSTGEADKLKSWLPADKQFIRTRNGKKLLIE
jgi:ubiquitin-like-conjugating enzyme ATG3